MTKGCYTCRRRRIVCDNGFPVCRKCRNSGKECLGYQKPLVWVKGGVASRGKMMGLSYDDVASPSSSHVPSGATLSTVDSGTQHEKLQSTEVGSHDGDSPADQDQAPNDSLVLSSRNYSMNSPIYSLIDPLFQDFNKTLRFYINVFNRLSVPCLALYDAVQNPYRDLIRYVNGSPVLADSLAAIGAIQFAYKSENCGKRPVDAEVGDDMSTTEGMVVTKPHDTRAYGHFLTLKQRALHQLSVELLHPLARIDDRTVAAIFVLILLDVIESGNTSWMYHLEGAKNILRSRMSNAGGLIPTDGIDAFLVDACLITEIMGSTLARPGVLSRPFYSPQMGSAMLKRLEKTAWVGCPAYLLDVIFFVHAQRYSDGGQTTEYSLSFLLPSGEATRAESPLAVLLHIDAFDAEAWTEEMQSYLALSDTSKRLALARAYKAAVYLYARRVLSRTPAYAQDCALLAFTRSDSPQSRRTVEDILIQNIFLIPPEDEHFKCLIWPTFIAGAESTTREQRAITLRTLGLLWTGLISLNLQNAACVLKVMWEKQDERRRSGIIDTGVTNQAVLRHEDDDKKEEDEDEDEEGFDWIQELDQSSTDWLFI